MVQLDAAFLEKVDAAIAGWKSSVSYNEHKHLQKLVLRKDLRCRDFSCAERDIFAPLLPRLTQKQEFTDLLVGGSDEMYEEYVAKVQNGARDAMKLLTMPGSVCYSRLGQFLLELGDSILDGRLKGDMARNFLRDHYEKKILKYNFGSSDSKVTLESILKDTLPQNASDAEKTEQANLAIQVVMLYEGVTALVNKARLKEYGARLKQNRAVFNEELAAFTTTPEFAAYARKEGAARGLSNSSSTREQALRQTLHQKHGAP